MKVQFDIKIKNSDLNMNKIFVYYGHTRQKFSRIVTNPFTTKEENKTRKHS